MKKLLLYTALLIIPLISSAQSEPVIYKDFNEGIRDVANTFKLDEHTGIIQVNLNNDDFEMTAIDENMKVLWRTKLKGYAVSCGKFKGKILAVAATDYSILKGPNGIYKGFLLDPKTGKLEVEKTLYGGTGQSWDNLNTFFTTDGSYFRMAIRQTGLSRTMFKLIKNGNDFYKTKDLTVIDFDEKLEVSTIVKPSFSDGTFINITGNYEGDLYLALFTGGKTVQVSKYEAGKKTPSAIITQDIDLRNTGDNDPGNHIKLLASESDRNVLYFSVLYKNFDKNIHLDVARLDFSKNTKNVVTEIFDKDHIKQIEKSFVPVNKKVRKAYIGSASNIEVRHMTEENGTLLVAMSNRYVEGGTYTSWFVEMAILINGYDLNLKTKFQQLMPTFYACGVQYLPAGFYTNNNMLYIVANNKEGLTSFNSVYGELDIETGKWKRMDILLKKKLKNIAFADGPNALWFNKSVIIPFFEPGGFTGRKFDLALLQNAL